MILLPNLVELIKKAAVDAVEAASPVNVMYGTVMSVNPLKISLEQKLILDEDSLVLSSFVRDFDVEMYVDHETEEAGGELSLHKHKYTGAKKFKVNLGLKENEKVILVRMQGGQKYLVLDRIRQVV